MRFGPTLVLSSLAVAASVVLPPVRESESAPSTSPRKAPTVAAMLGPRVDAATRGLFSHRQQLGRTLPMYRSNTRFERDGILPVYVRFTTPPSGATLDALRHRGITFLRNGEPLASGAYHAEVTEAALEVLENEPTVQRVVPALARQRLPTPLDLSNVETRALDARHATIVKDGTVLDGAGTVIADIDTPIFQFHPALFRADGGVTTWTDVDGDGVLTPGVDGTDLDGDGTIAPNEVLQRIAGVALARTQTKQEIDPSNVFRPDRDYLYVDSNGNGKRDYGKGFAESTPGYGEPIFVFDDANHDGTPQATERLLRLGSSKVKRVFADGIEYARGGGSGVKSLVDFDATTTSDASFGDYHGTAAAGVLAAGIPGISRFLGIAPGAEIIEHDTESEGGTVSAVQWAIDQKANVILTEYAPYVFVSLDGSSEDEAILDAANAKGILTVSPSGDLAGGGKHRTLTLQPGDTHLALHGNDNFATVSAIEMSFHFLGAARSLTFHLTPPGAGALPIAIPDAAFTGLSSTPGLYLYVAPQTTTLGTHEKHMSLFTQPATSTGTAPPMPAGDYDLQVTLDAGAPLVVDLYVGDNVNPWSRGLTLDSETLARTVCNPATSKTTLSIGAYVLHGEAVYAPYGKAGDLASYSSQGPLLAGAPGIAIAAPDNPVSIATPIAGKNDAMYAPFGGTSGAGPHVAGAIALLRQAHPDASPNQIRSMLLGGAKAAGDPSTMGAGKMDIAKAAGLDVTSGSAPQVILSAVGGAYVGKSVKMHLDIRDDEDPSALSARWDFDYDGTPDTDWIPIADTPIPTPNLGSFGVRVDVRDGQGNVSGATAIVDVTKAPPPAADDGGDSGCGVARGGANAAAPFAGLVALALAAARRRRRR